MRFWKVSLIVFLATIPLLAQSPVPVAPNPLPLFPNEAFLARVQAQQQTDAQIILNELRSQMQQLADQVRLLQAEIEAMKSESLQTQTVAREKPSNGARSTPAVLVFRDGRRVETSGYIVGRDKVWVIQDGSPVGVSLSDLNLQATRRENLNRGIEFAIPPQ